jgi:hypothetical protein
LLKKQTLSKTWRDLTFKGVSLQAEDLETGTRRYGVWNNTTKGVHAKV